MNIKVVRHWGVVESVPQKTATGMARRAKYCNNWIQQINKQHGIIA